MEERCRAIVQAIGADAVSGATEILERAADLLLTVADDRQALNELASACVDAQPSMAGLLTLHRLASAATDPATAIARFQAQVRRAPDTIARHAASVLLLQPEPRSPGRPQLRIVTCSRSRAVEITLLRLAADAELTVCCAESRPKGEGVDLATRLAEASMAVELFSDAGISAAVPGSDALLVGADAIGPDFFVNKVGTAALCALAQARGVPVYALSGREKRLVSADLGRLRLVEGPPSGLLDAVPPGVTVRNPYFEQISLSFLSLLITDAGAVEPFGMT